MVSVFGRKIANSFNAFGKKISTGLGGAISQASTFGQKVGHAITPIVNGVYSLNKGIQNDPALSTIANAIPGYGDVSSLINMAKAGTDALNKTSNIGSQVGNQLTNNNSIGALKTVASAL